MHNNNAGNTRGIPLWGIHVNAGLPLLPSHKMATKGGKKKGPKNDPPMSEDVHDSTSAKSKSFFGRRSSKKKSSGSGSSSHQSLKALNSQPSSDWDRRSPELQSQNPSLVTPASSDNVFPPDESAPDFQGELFHDDPEKVRGNSWLTIT